MVVGSKLVIEFHSNWKVRDPGTRALRNLMVVTEELKSTEENQSGGKLVFAENS